MTTRSCASCSERFDTAQPDATYCSDGCRQRAYRERLRAGVRIGRRRGATQQAVLDQLAEAGDFMTVIELAGGRDKDGRVNPSRYESIRRAADALYREGLLEYAWTRGELSYRLV